MREREKERQRHVCPGRAMRLLATPLIGRGHFCCVAQGDRKRARERKTERERERKRERE